MYPIFSHRPASRTTLLHDLKHDVRPGRYRKHEFPAPRRILIGRPGRRK
jgi:hypothetical protein